MGYSIFYDKQFVKLESTNTFIPMVLGGSSNCYEYINGGRERRERSWFNFSHITNGKIHATMDEMLTNVMAERQMYIKRNQETLKNRPEWDIYDDSRFGFFAALAINGGTHNTTFGQYKGIVLTGCNKALTIAQLASENIYLTLFLRAYTDETKTKMIELFGENYYNFTVKDEAGLLEETERVSKLISGTELTLYVGFVGLHEDTPKWLRKKYFPNKRKSKVVDKSNGFYNIHINGYGKFIKFTSRQMRFTTWGDGWVTDNQNQAKKKFTQIKEKLHKFYTLRSKIELVFNNPDGDKEIIESISSLD